MAQGITFTHTPPPPMDADNPAPYPLPDAYGPVLVGLYFALCLGLHQLGLPLWACILEGIRFLFGTALGMGLLEQGVDLGAWDHDPTGESHSEPMPPIPEGPTAQQIPRVVR